MTQLRRDAAYIRTETRTGSAAAVALTDFDEKVYDVLASAHTVVSATKKLTKDSPPAAGRAADDLDADLEAKVADSMLRLLQADRIELSPDS